MERRPTVLIAGIGELGGLVLELLVRTGRFEGRIVAADVNEDLARRKTISALQGAIAWGAPAEIEASALDLANVDDTAAKLAAWRPDLIFNATTLSSWWLRDLLPEESRAKLHAIGAGSGIWIASHAALTYNLMRAARMAAIRPFVINSAYPDAVNAALSKIGLGPDLGIGNGDLLIPAFRQLAALEFGVSPRRVTAYVVAHHFHNYNILVHGTTHGLPFYMRIMIDSEDVTARIDRDRFVASVPVKAPIPAAAGATWIVAASAIKTLLAALHRTGEIIHAPGPLGMVGGYPIAMTTGGPQLALPPDITLDRAVALNWGAQRAEGIERIEDDGTIVLTAIAAATIKAVFGLDLPRYRPDDFLSIARELTQCLRRLGERHGLKLKVH